ncbi:MAG: pseudouridine synthase, partial [Pseudomonadota bacterium]|nr:pseudouridine synthase [Pseudomonadota bacterium]
MKNDSNKRLVLTQMPKGRRPLDIEPVRLQKFLANQGFGSRRQLEQAIAASEIKVNGQVAQLGAQVQLGDKIEWQRKRFTVGVQPAQLPRVLMYNKPEGEICTRQDPEGRKTVFAALPRLKDARWISVGRLDINTSGLLLFTDDGELANRLMHPSNELPRYYAVRVLGEVEQEHIEQLRTGVELEDGVSRFESVEDLGGEGANCWYRVRLIGGKNREVRRLWESLGFMISRLIRVQFGDLRLPENLYQGKVLELSSDQVQQYFDIPVQKVEYTAVFDRRRGAKPSADTGGRHSRYGTKSSPSKRQGQRAGFTKKRRK